ncbi:hypothetical protein [Ralstonia pseudosolanacearum]|uniref:hypothetical protein n=1 Tax=Ralstonia pseudosolanacearum TaxID=1310165 RepID=UPI002005F749|nr:hypothetical protein [Ralstonia pseudosolanacearum]MCK4153489.1 hypothetical protein [Ralstonia pseudosolanacearum]
MPANSTPIVLLFEDDPSIVKDFVKRVKPKLGKACQLEVFPLDESPENSRAPYEDRVEAWIRKSGFYERLVLLVTDRDLSANSKDWSGLSQTAVSGAAKVLGLPVAGYRRAKPNPVDEFKRIPGDGLIDLSPDIVVRAAQVASLAKGFIDLQKRIKEWHDGSDDAGKTAPKKRRPAGAAAVTSPGALLAGVLHQPVAAAHFDTFACGDQVAIGEILKFSQDSNARMSAHVQRGLVAALGVWLTDLVMKYPGVLVNEIAAASYLDIHPEDFARVDVQKLFKGALYTKLPFEDSDARLWWRHLLDEILAAAECTSGLELCEKRGLSKVRYCPCSVDPKLHAGYYCMATNQPISAEKSSGRVRWFPPGADLARLQASTYRKLAPWIG